MLEVNVVYHHNARLVRRAWPCKHYYRVPRDEETINKKFFFT